MSRVLLSSVFCSRNRALQARRGFPNADKSTFRGFDLRNARAQQGGPGSQTGREVAESSRDINSPEWGGTTGPLLGGASVDVLVILVFLTRNSLFLHLTNSKHNRLF